MKKKRSTILTGIWIMALYIFSTIPAIAQKEKEQSLVTEKKGQSLVTEEQIARVNELVKPLKEQIDKQLNGDQTGTYKAYQEDISKLSSTKDAKEKSSLTKKINEKYTGFFKSVWEAANVDEKSYQSKIMELFPGLTRKQLQFSPFLNFSITSSSPGTTPPVQEPPVENKCLDICSIALGEVRGTSALISGGGGTFGNCFLRTNAWGAAAGKNELYGFLRNNITIPGTLPNDARKLRVRKSFELSQEATSFAVLGFGYAETWISTYQAREYLFVMSPVIFMNSKVTNKTINEEYVLEKADVGQSIFKTYSGTMAYFISGNWCFSQCTSIKWNICEEK